jgi:hypothetical protein
MQRLKVYQIGVNINNKIYLALLANGYKYLTKILKCLIKLRLERNKCPDNNANMQLCSSGSSLRVTSLAA